MKNKEDIETVVDEGFNVERVNNNPRRLTKHALRKLIEEIL